MKYLIPFAAIAILAATRTLADDHGNTLQTATSFTGTEIHGTLETATDEDWFKIEIHQPGRVWIYSSGTTDTHGRLYNHAGAVISNMTDDNSGKSYNFHLGSATSSYSILPAGTYYLRVRGGDTIANTGPYTIHLRSFEKATVLGGGDHLASLTLEDHTHIYRFTTHQPGRTWIYTTGSTDTHGRLYNHAGAAIANMSDDNSGASYNFHLGSATSSYNILPAGTYYLKVTGGGSIGNTGDYGLHIRSFEHAIQLDGRDHHAALGDLGHRHAYRFNVPAPGRVWIHTTGPTDTFGRLYDHVGNAIANMSDDNSGASYNFHIGSDSSSYNVLPAGTYYLVVSGGSTQGSGTRPYSLHISQPGTATPILAPGATSHHLDLGDLHLYAFSTTGGQVTLSSTGNTNTTASLYGPTGTRIATDSTSGGQGNFSITANLGAGIHYLKIEGASRSQTSGGYQLHTSFPAGHLTQLATSATQAPASNSTQLEIHSNQAWTATNIPSWVSLSQTSGTGNASLTVSFAPNHTGAPRNATLMIGGVPHQLVQAPAGSDAIPTSGPASLGIHPAVILSIQTIAGKHYRIETSTNLANWQDTGIEFIGNGLEMSSAIERTQSRAYFRAVID